MAKRKADILTYIKDIIVELNNLDIPRTRFLLLPSSTILPEFSVLILLVLLLKLIVKKWMKDPKKTIKLISNK